MPTSLPAREIYVIDVPDVEALNSRFVYNYFVTNESIDETSGVNSRYMSVLDTLSTETDVQRYATRVPRWIELSFKPVKVNDPTNNYVFGNPNKMQKVDVALSRGSKGRKSLIVDNIDKIMSEDEFASYYYVSLDFRDSRLYDKMHDLVSGTLVYTSLLGEPTVDDSLSLNRSGNARALHANVLQFSPPSIDSSFVSKCIDNVSRFGVNSITQQQSVVSQRMSEDLSRVTPEAQINCKFVSSMLERAIKDPLSHLDVNTIKTYESMMTVQSMAREHLKSSIVSMAELKTNARPMNVMHTSAAGCSSKHRVEMLGYIIDKIEVLQDGSTVTHDPIVVDDPHKGLIVDWKVKYYSTYTYVIRSLALVTMSALLEDMNDLANAQFIIASHPTSTIVHCLENVPPPGVSDLGFVWDYDEQNLVISWSFPPNPQRDVKKFLIYRRLNVNEPFELLKLYDFDDSAVKVALDGYDPQLIELQTQPMTWYVDKEFNKGSKYIYAIMCIDAHGIKSYYSSQFEVSFDVFKNRLIKRLISHQGAPEQLPNLYLESDAFVDTICDGPNHVASKNPCGPHGRFTLYFTPECYNVTKDDIKKPVVITQQMGGKYSLSVINVDNQQQQIVDVYINDQTGKKT